MHSHASCTGRCGKFYIVLVTEIIGDVDTATTAYWPAVCVGYRASFAVFVFVNARLAVVVVLGRICKKE